MTQTPKAKTSSKKDSANQEDIIDLILEDHKPLKKLIKVMKNTDKSIDERRQAFKEFAPLLAQHAKPEEKVLYVHLKDEEDMREEGFEGDVEHVLADQMVEEVKHTRNEDLWSARVKVLAELVEHHIEEEEEDMLPEFKKHSNKEDRIELGSDFLKAKQNTLPDGNERVPTKAKDKHSMMSMH